MPKSPERSGEMDINGSTHDKTGIAFVRRIISNCLKVHYSIFLSHSINTCFIRWISVRTWFDWSVKMARNFKKHIQEGDVLRNNWSLKFKQRIKGVDL